MNAPLRSLDLAYPIPDVALDDRLGWIGTSGSGKTYNAGAGVERLLRKRARVVIVDPLDVWWGLRLDSRGQGASGHNVVIFGGQHADLPLTEHVGALISETVATMAYREPHCRLPGRRALFNGDRDRDYRSRC